MDWILNVILSVSIGSLSLFVLLSLKDIFLGKRKKYVKKVPYTQLVNEVMYYTGGLLHQNGIKIYPQVEVRYYKNKQFAGLHYPEGRIVIYTKSHTDVIQIVNTVLHEVGHHFQMKTDSKEYKRYSEYQKVYKWEDNPCEKFACEFASKHQQYCLDFLLSKDIIAQV